MISKNITIAEARAALAGVREWEWGEGLSFDEAAAFAQRVPNLLHDDCLLAVYAYLLSQGEDPSDFGLNRYHARVYDTHDQYAREWGVGVLVAVDGETGHGVISWGFEKTSCPLEWIKPAPLPE